MSQPDPAPPTSSLDPTRPLVGVALGGLLVMLAGVVLGGLVGTIAIGAGIGIGAVAAVAIIAGRRSRPPDVD